MRAPTHPTPSFSWKFKAFICALMILPLAFGIWWQAGPGFGGYYVRTLAVPLPLGIACAIIFQIIYIRRPVLSHSVLAVYIVSMLALAGIIMGSTTVNNSVSAYHAKRHMAWAQMNLGHPPAIASEVAQITQSPTTARANQARLDEFRTASADPKIVQPFLTYGDALGFDTQFAQDNGMVLLSHRRELYDHAQALAQQGNAQAAEYVKSTYRPRE